MKIRIVSLFAMTDPSRAQDHFAWEGDVAWLSTLEPRPPEVLAPEDSDEVLLDRIYRAFNRVDESDNERLRWWGYTLPSLSSGDLVGIKRPDQDSYALFRVASAGFTTLFPGMDR